MKCITSLAALVVLLPAAMSQGSSPVSLVSNDPFVYRQYEKKQLSFNEPPPALDAQAPYFSNRQLTYEVLGETATRGVITGFDAAQGKRFEASYIRNALNGVSKTYHTNGRLRDSGNMVMNLPNGTWHFYHANGKLRSVRNYDAPMWWSLIWSIELRNPFWNHWDLAALYERNPKAYTRAVDAAATFNDTYAPCFAFCLQHGAWMDFYETGQLAETGQYFKGMKDGLWQTYFPNGNLHEMGAWKMGGKNGTWKTLKENGDLESLKFYRNGRLIESKNYETRGTKA